MSPEGPSPYRDYVIPLESMTRHFGQGWLKPILASLAQNGLGMSKSPTIVLTLGKGLVLHAITRQFEGLGQFKDKKTIKQFQLPYSDS